MSPENTQQWIKNRYLTLLERFQENEFSFEEGLQALAEKHSDNPPQVKKILSFLRRSNFIQIKRYPEDRRQKLYRVIPIVTESKTKELSRNEIEGILKRAADIIRTRVDYTFILLLLFYKRISDKWLADFDKEIQKLVKEGFNEEEARTEARSPVYHDLDLPREFLWDELHKNPLNLSANLSRAMKEIADRNPNLKDIFTQFDFLQFARNPENNEILRQLFELFSSYTLEHTSADILGDAYEWILRYFAPAKAKEGEVYTPREVIALMIEILQPRPGTGIYDVSCGSAGMLILSHQYVINHANKSKADTLFLYGQEANARTLALAKMNLIIHDIKHAQLEPGDTLLFPKFKESKGIKTFDYVIANPPWNQDGYGEETLKKGDFWQERFPFGFPTRQSADWAWVQHMFSSLNNKGKVAVVLDTGAIARGSGKRSDKEKAIRRQFVEKDLIECVILLPENLFYNTPAPGIILTIDKNKPKERKEKILLINASHEFDKGKPKNFLTKRHIENIAGAYSTFKNKEGFCAVITLKQAQEADYNLSPSRFVSTIQTETHRPIKEIWDDLRHLERERKKTEDRLEKIIQRILLPCIHPPCKAAKIKKGE